MMQSMIPKARLVQSHSQEDLGLVLDNPNKSCHFQKHIPTQTIYLCTVSIIESVRALSDKNAR